jgi:ATP-binding cassette subfamily B protein
VALLTVLKGGLPAVQLWVSKLLIDTVALAIQADAQDADGYLGRLFFLASAQAGVSLLGTILDTFQSTLRSLLGELLSNQISLQILRKTNSLDIAFFESEQFYDKLQNAYREAASRPLEIISQLFSLVQLAVTFSSLVLLLFRLHWAILPLIAITTLPTLLVQSRYGGRNYWMLRRRAPELRKQQYFGNLLTSDWFIKEIRVFQLENYFLNLYRSLFEKFFRENRNLVVQRDLNSVMASAGSLVGWLLTVVYVIVQTVEHNITIGDLALYTQGVSMAQGQFQALLSGLSGLYSNGLFIRNLFEFFALPSRDPASGKLWTEPIIRIEFQNVSFCYPGTDRQVLHDVSFQVGRGQSLALVGRNGAGKTTIVKLLCRLYEPTRGKILVNGEDIADYAPQSVQKQMAVLFQDYGHYQLTARENIGMGRLAQVNDMAAIEAAARRSGADSFIHTLQHGYETTLGRWFKGGAELSVGQWQKVALARAFLRKGGLLILDEPTAALDAEAEFEVFEELLHDSSTHITLLISHRFSTVRMADCILVLEDGRCIESGSHEALMAVGGQYARLFKLQAKGYNDTMPQRRFLP